MEKVTVVLSRDDFNVIRFALRDQITANQNRLASLKSELETTNYGAEYIKLTIELRAVVHEYGKMLIHAANSFMSSAGFGDGPERSEQP